MTVEIQKRGSHRRIVIDSVNSNGEFLNDVETELVLLNPELNSTPIPVQQTAPGRYEADLTTDLPGAWHVQLTQKQNGQTLSQQTRGLVVGYNDELRLRQPNTELLQALAELTAGAVQPTPQQATTLQDGRVRQTAVPLWPWLLTIACLLFVADVMLKRLELSKWFGTQQHRTEYRGNPSA